MLIKSRVESRALNWILQDTRNILQKEQIHNENVYNFGNWKEKNYHIFFTIFDEALWINLQKKKTERAENEKKSKKQIQMEKVKINFH